MKLRELENTGLLILKQKQSMPLYYSQMGNMIWEPYMNVTKKPLCIFLKDWKLILMMYLNKGIYIAFA